MSYWHQLKNTNGSTNESFTSTMFHECFLWPCKIGCNGQCQILKTYVPSHLFHVLYPFKFLQAFCWRSHGFCTLEHFAHADKNFADIFIFMLMFFSWHFVVVYTNISWFGVGVKLSRQYQRYRKSVSFPFRVRCFSLSLPLSLFITQCLHRIVL